jgi:RNA polymerase sigma-70 factor (ECF subfamily)
LQSGTADALSVRHSEIEDVVVGLFDQFRNPLLRYTISLGLSVQEAEEVAQDVFLALFQHLRQGKSRHSLPGWIFRVAHNLAIRQRFAASRSRELTSSDWTAGENHRDPSPSPEERVLSALRLRRFVAVFRVLPEQDQCCLRLRAEGLRYREIAAVLDISLGAVSISITRSLARLICADSR